MHRDEEVIAFICVRGFIEMWTICICGIEREGFRRKLLHQLLNCEEAKLFIGSGKYNYMGISE